MRQLLLVILFLLLSVSLCYSQSRKNNLYISLSPNLQIVHATDQSPPEKLVTYPFAGTFINFGYTCFLKNNFSFDLDLGYNIKTFKYNFNREIKGMILVGKLEVGGNIGYRCNISDNKKLLIHAGYAIDFYGVQDTVIFATNTTTTYCYGSSRPNMYLEMGFGVLKTNKMHDVYFGVSFKKGFVKSQDLIVVYTQNNISKFYRAVSFQDNLSFNLKYYLYRNKKSERFQKAE